MNRAKLIAAAFSLAFALAPAEASASLIFNFTETSLGTDLAGRAITPFSVTGQFTTTDVLVGGAYTIQSLTGTRTGDGTGTISFLSTGSLGGNDNRLFFGQSTLLDTNGFGYTAGGVDYNVYASGSTGGCAGYLEISSTSPATVCSTERRVSFSISQVSGVPEPATWAMMLVGFGAMGVSMRRRRSATALQAA